MAINLEKQRLIVCDLDGTLLDDNEKISSKTIKTVKELTKQGHIFCISTGRPLRSAIYYYNQLGLNTVICTLNGGVISNPSEKDNFLPINLCYGKHILLEILKNKVISKYANYMFVETFDNVYWFSKKHYKLSNEFLKIFHINNDELIVFNNFNFESINKLKFGPNSILLSVKKELIDVISFEIKRLTSTLIVRTWDFDMDNSVIIEINSINSTKGSALKFLSCYYGIPLRNIFAFGDGINDIEMLRLTTRAYAMNNAIPMAKLVSYKITEQSNNDDGVANTLIKIFKLKVN